MKTTRNIFAIVMIAIAAIFADSNSVKASTTDHYQLIVRTRVGPGHRVYHRRYYHRPYRRAYYRRTYYHRPYHRPYRRVVVHRRVVRRY